MKILKRLMIFGLIGAITFGIAGCGKKKTEGDDVIVTSVTESKAVAKVGDVDITEEQLEEQVKLYKEMIESQLGPDFSQSDEGKEFIFQMRGEMLNNLMYTELALQMAEKLDIEVTDEDVDNVFEMEKSGFESVEMFEEALSQSGVTSEELWDDIKKSLTIDMVMEKTKGDISVSQEEIEAYFNENIRDFNTSKGAYMRHILALENEADAQALYEKLEGGIDFEEVFEKYLEESEGFIAEQLGFVEFDNPGYDQLFLAGASEVEAGTYSKPIKSDFGWHIVFIDSIQEAQEAIIEDVSGEIEEFLLMIKDNEETMEAMDKWEEEIGVEIYDKELENIINGPQQ